MIWIKVQCQGGPARAAVRQSRGIIAECSRPVPARLPPAWAAACAPAVRNWRENMFSDLPAGQAIFAAGRGAANE